MRRRDLILRTGLLVTAIFLRPSRVSALGGNVLNVGAPAPTFKLAGANRLQPEQTSWSLEDYRSRWLAIYFYPKDFTGGCTIEARGFEALHPEFLAAGAEVIGISADGLDDHESFCESEGLSFPLLSDPEGAISKAYGSWMAPYSLRHTFLIDPEGVLRQRWVAVRPSGHAQEVLDVLKNLQNKTSV
ncbi:peroxiredoxin [Synechococcus sp. M16CYN]|uniref:peroxiredoxin n=1 Tax=Synechococcus sp. M16CYN TaxID=3103139 RepID=UPI00324E97FB